MRLTGAAGAAVVCCVLAGCDPKSTTGVAKPVSPGPAEEAAGPTLFEDITPTTGIRHTYQNGEDPGEHPKHLAIIESIGGGVALFDSTGTACSTSSSPAAASSPAREARTSSAGRASCTATSATSSSRT